MNAVTPDGRPGRADAPRFSPLYRQIKGLITRGLQAGDWKPGEPIPSESELAQRFGVSQGTVRKAIDELAAENLVVRRQGRGTFVATHHEERAQFRFLRLRRDDGAAAGPMESRILECRRMRAPLEIARALGLRAGETVVSIRRLLSFEGRPTVLDDIWLPGSLFRGLSAERLVASVGPLYGLFESEFGVRMIRAAERLRAVLADAEGAALLGVAEGSPLLQAERVTYTYEDRPVEVRRGLYVTERFHYFNALG
jgi:GntR family transcriptional regulator